MSNYISFKEEDISFSNGMTDVLLTVIGLSGSKLAAEDWEKNLIVWLMQRDQNCIGRGTVGFDLAELPWEREKFVQQKIFLQKVLKEAGNKLGWNLLDYSPNEEAVFALLKDMGKLLEKMEIEDIDEEHTLEWIREDEGGSCIPAGYPKCSKHGILLSIFGCLACNDK